MSGGDWLTVTPTQGFTPSQLAVSLNATRVPQLPAGTYTANITINTLPRRIQPGSSRNSDGKRLDASDGG